MKRKFMVQRNFCDWDKLVFLWRENFEKHLDWWFSAAKSSEIEWLIRKHWDRNFKHQTIAKWRKTVFSFRYISICRHLNCVCMLTCFATLSLSLSSSFLDITSAIDVYVCVCVCGWAFLSRFRSIECWRIVRFEVQHTFNSDGSWKVSVKQQHTKNQSVSESNSEGSSVEKWKNGIANVHSF